MDQSVVSLVVFIASLLATFFVAAVGRRTAKRRNEDDLAGRSLNRWLVGLSAGATANSGFVVTGAVGLGYSFGMQWIMMPVAWFLGDLVFWYWFPERINAFGHKTGAVTLSEILSHGLEGRWATAVSLMTTIVIVAGLAGYTAAQWLAGQKFLAGAFGLPAHVALAMFALLIISYSSIGGFRGSVYADAFQAVIRLAATTLVLVTSIWIAVGEGGAFQARIDATGNDFFNPFPGATLATGIGFVVGWAAAAMGFGLGQPHIVSRYLASSSPSETRAARWIYLGFVQFTWISMTVFGMILRGIMPDLDDPEAGLSVFVQTFLFAAVSGVIVADVFGVIASTANSLLISMAQSLRHDVLDRLLLQAKTKVSLGIITLLAGLSTMVLSAVMGGSVVSLALSSVSMVGAGLAVPVMIKVSGWKHTGASLTGSMVVGIASAAIWVQVGFPTYLNEAAIGMLFSFGANWLLLMALPTITASRDANQTAARDQFEDA